MKTIYTTRLIAMAGGLFACSSSTTSDGGTTIGGNTTGGTSATATTGGTSATTTGGTSATTTTGGSSATTGGTTGATIPPFPTIGSEIDRMGRPAINTALTAPLGAAPLPDGGALAEPAAKDLYNSDNTPADWATNWTYPFATSLAVYDGLDGICGNQPAAGKPDAGSPMAYFELGGVLTDDELYLDTTLTSCVQYLGVEFAFLTGVADFDCGGRTPLENTIDTTYSVLATGNPTGVTNGVTMKAGTQASITVFPYLATPN